MRILYFDCFSGISGDMTIGALLDLGIDKEIFLRELSKLDLDGFEIEIQSKTVRGIRGTDVNVVLSSVAKHDHGHSHGDNGHSYDGHGHCHDDHGHSYDDHGHSHDDHGHSHDDHGHSHDDHGHSHDDHGHNHNGRQNNKQEIEYHHKDMQSNPHTYAQGINVPHTQTQAHTHTQTQAHTHTHAHGERGLPEIEQILDNSRLSSRVKAFSKKVFREIAAAEAKVHGKPINEVHFHEVGAIDSIVDIAGTAICLELLGVEKVYSSPLHDGSGLIECAHGLIPVPVPAVMEMLSGSGIPLISEDVNTELVTPTGMGIIKCIAAGFGSRPAMTIEKTGYGHGKRDTGRLNALRAILGVTFEKQLPGCGDEISVLETNIDDTTGEIMGYTMSRLMEAGALDAFYTPVYMKKNRPAYMLTVIAAQGMEDSLAEIILRETSTLGIRTRSVKRYCMDREIVKINTPYGEARVKIASMGDFRKASPEYEDCRKIAESAGLSLAKAYSIVSSDAIKLYGL